MRTDEWWRRAVIYEVYPRSFQDTDGDGVGDLKGVEQRLDHLVWLGVDALWIAPFYTSPMRDFGYDVADYCSVDPLFGAMAHFDSLLAAAHARGLKVLVDFVPNHTSDQHPWFTQSRASRTGNKHDWYIWRDAKANGSPPNNWPSIFGGSAWTWDEGRGQFYLHSFLASQPDLNWRNPAVEAAMLDAMRFWLERGVDGFRVDAYWTVIKDEALRDNPPDPDWREGHIPYLKLKPAHSGDRPELMEVARRMRRLTDSYAGDRVIIGEIYLPIRRLVAYYGVDGDGLHLPFNFKLLQANWTAEEIGDTIGRYLDALPPGGCPNWVLGNHDQPRIASKVGARMARAAAVLLLALPGAITLYYGEELGMTDVDVPPDRRRDPRNWTEPGLGRDGARTPMLWSSDSGAGFSQAKPWLPLSPDYCELSVVAQRDDPASMLNLYRRLLALRPAEPALVDGAVEQLCVEGDVLRFERVMGARRLTFAMNFSDAPAELTLPCGSSILVSSDPSRQSALAGAAMQLMGHEAVLLDLASAAPAPS